MMIRYWGWSNGMKWMLDQKFPMVVEVRRAAALNGIDNDAISLDWRAPKSFSSQIKVEGLSK